MRIGILGPLTVHGGTGTPIDITAAGPRLLLLRLAIDAGRVVTSDTLIDDLWPGAAPADPTGALQTLIARLRRTLGQDRAAITSPPAGYALDIAPANLDATRFAELVNSARAELRAGRPAHAADTLRAALALWRGPALADAPGAEFAIAPRTRLTELHDAAHLDRVAADLAVQPPVVDPAVLVAELEEVDAAHPLRERPAALLINALLRTGRRADALATYDRVRVRLGDELGMDPGPELRAAHQAALSDQPDDQPAAPVTNLPAARSSFVGRETELGAVRDLLRGARLVTLTGFGGVGKTRLAIEAATGPTPPEGTWLVELASVTEPSGIAPAVLAAFGRHGGDLLGQLDQPGATIEPQQRLLGLLADKSLLLVLDNCEQIIDGVAELADRLLSRCAGLRILATSREPLGITGEVRYPVSPLGAAAARLFTERAKAASPGLRLDAETVERICAALDGIPLAIELAAARLSSLTPRQLAERIDARFGLLGPGARTNNARHRTLRAALDWSWDLLDEPERVLLRRLAVFAGGAELSAIERVCATPDALDLISGLVDKSLVVLRRHDTDTARYGLLATLREYAAERLTEAGEGDRLRRSHARHYAEFARALEPRLRTAEQLDALARLDGEARNLDAALGHACTLPAPDIALTLVAASMWRWSIRGQRVEAQHWSGEALRVAGEVAPPGFEYEYGLCRLVALDQQPLSESRDLLRTWRQPAVLAASNLGRWPTTFDPIDMKSHFIDTANWLVEQPEPWLRATGEFSRGVVAAEFVAGGAWAAERHLRTSLAAFTGIGDRWGLFYASYQLCQVLDQLGDYEKAAELLVRARSYAQALGGADALPVPLMTMIHSAELHTKAGDYATATTELAEAGAAAERIGDPVAAARVLHARGELARRTGDLIEAVRLHEATVRLATELAERATPADGLSPQFIARAHSSLGRALALVGDQTAARDRHGRAIALLATTIDAPVRAGILESAAEWCVEAGHAEAAAVLLGAAAALRGDGANLPEVRAVRERCRSALGQAAFQHALDRGQAMSNLETLALPEN